MHRSFQAFVLSGIILTSVMGSAAAFVQNPQVTVSVFSDVQIPSDVLLRAEQRAGKIFAQAGLELLWIDCTPASASGSNCKRTYGATDFVLRITSHVAAATSDAAFGVAFLGADGRGRYADVFWPKAQEFNAKWSIDLDRILGCVIAHEMGHLLLGLNSHSISGVMRAHWGSNELRQINRGNLLFLPEQGKRMRARFVDASSAEISMGTRKKRHS